MSYNAVIVTIWLTVLAIGWVYVVVKASDGPVMAAIAAAVVVILIFGAVAYFCYRVYQDQFRGDLTRAMVLIGLIASLIFLSENCISPLLEGI